MWCARSFFIVYENLLVRFVQDFLYWGDGGVLSNNNKFGHLPTPHQIFIPSHRKSIQPNKIFFSCVHCSCTIFVLISYSFKGQSMLILILIDAQYSQNAVFSFEKFLNRQNHSSSGSHHLVKRFPEQFSLLFD